MKKDLNEKKTGKFNKLIAVLLALALWFYVAGQGQLTAQNAVAVDLNYIKLADNLTVSGPDKVTVRMWGTIRETDRVEEAYVDLAGLGPGSYNLPVNLHQSNRALFAKVEPNRVEVVIREIKKNSVAIDPRVDAQPPAGFELVDIFTVPERCSVQGNQTEVSRVKYVIAPVSLTGSPEIQNSTVTLKALDKDGNLIEGVRLVPAKAAVYAVVSETLVSKQAAIKPVYQGDLPEGFELGQISVEPEAAALIGASALTEKLSEIGTKAIDLSGKTKSFTIEAELSVPEGIKAYPTRAAVYIEIKAVNPAEPGKTEE